MPKINVYLPDDLAEAVRAAGVPVSTVCQRALEEAVRNARATIEIAPTFERFTQRARNAMGLATAAAANDGVDMGSEHLLIGLFLEGAGVAARALTALGVTEEGITAALETRSTLADAAPVLRQALQEALKLGHNYIGTEHVALGLGQSGSLASDVLMELGVTRAALKHEVISILTGMGVPAPAAFATEPVTAKLDSILTRLENLEKKLTT